MEQLAQCEATIVSQQVGFSSVPCGLLVVSVAAWELRADIPHGKS